MAACLPLIGPVYIFLSLWRLLFQMYHAHAVTCVHRLILRVCETVKNLYTYIPGDGPPDEGAQGGDGWRTRTEACFRAAQGRMMLPGVFF